jgi:hypothetical protein
MMDLVPALLLVGIIALSGVLLLRSMSGCPASLEWFYAGCGTERETSPDSLAVGQPILLDDAAAAEPNVRGDDIDRRTFIGSAP